MLSFGQAESQARQLLAKASILAEAKAAHLSSGSKNSEEAHGPSGDAHDTYGFLAVRFGRCRSPEDFRAFCELAQREIDGVCKGKRIEVKEHTPAQRKAEIRALEGWDVDKVVTALSWLSVTRSEVAAVRLEMVVVVKDDPRALALARHKAGLGVSEIAKQLGKPKQTVSDWLRAA